MEKKIGIVGLGLIGGSMAKAIKKYTTQQVFGFDCSGEVISLAQKEGSIDFAGSDSSLEDIDILLVALYPKQTIHFIKEHSTFLKKGCIVVDLCGVKRYICDSLGPFCNDRNIIFIGGHPMAGREYSGYQYSLPTLFEGANMILTPTESTLPSALHEMKAFFYTLGFSKVVETSPQNHDRMIAFTSQLAHVVSNAYIKSPEALLHNGYSANSYKDLTRVARLNEEMWTELFICNQKPLLLEIDTIIAHLGEYRDAIAQKDHVRLKELLKAGSDLKKEIDEKAEL